MHQRSRSMGLIILALFLSTFSFVTAQSKTSTSASKTSASTSATRTYTNAKILYPTNGPTVNNIDVLDISYITNWTHTNLTLWCETNKQTNAWQLITRPLIDANGTFSMNPVQKSMDIPQFPVQCHLQLGSPQNKYDYVVGGGFTMISTGGTVKTWAAATASPTSVQTTAAGGSDGEASATPDPSGTSNPSGTPDNSGTSSGLSTGAKAGIGVGVALGVLAIISAVAFFVLRRRRAGKRSKRIDMPREDIPLYANDYKEPIDTKPFESDGREVQPPVESDGQPVYTRPELYGASAGQDHGNAAELSGSPISRR